MGSKKDLGKPVSGEVITQDDDDSLPVVGGVFSRLSRLPFVNKWTAKRLRTVREVAGEETGLFNDLHEHKKSFNRLKNMRKILREDDAMYEANAIAAENRLAEEKRKEGARKRDDWIYSKKKEQEEAELAMKHEYELKIKEAEYKKRLHEADKEVARLEAEKAQPKKRAPGMTGLFREKEKIDKEVAKRKEKVQSSDKSPEEKRSDMKWIESWREEMYERVEAQYRRERGDHGSA